MLIQDRKNTIDEAILEQVFAWSDAFEAEKLHQLNTDKTRARRKFRQMIQRACEMAVDEQNDVRLVHEELLVVVDCFYGAHDPNQHTSVCFGGRLNETNPEAIHCYASWKDSGEPFSGKAEQTISVFNRNYNGSYPESLIETINKNNKNVVKLAQENTKLRRLLSDIMSDIRCVVEEA